VLAFLNEALTSEDGLQFNKPHDSFKSSNRLSPIAPWQRTGPATYHAKATVPAGVIELLRNEPQFDFDTNTPNALRDVDVQFTGLTLGTNGLQPLLKAIERQAE
jgi:hypothetical protein